MIRESEKYGDVELSIVAGYGVHCTPHVDLPSLSQYDEFELGLLHRPWGLVCPSRLGLPEEMDWNDWQLEEIGSYISMSRLDLLRAALKDRAAGKKPDEIKALHEGRVEMMKVGKR